MIQLYTELGRGGFEWSRESRLQPALYFFYKGPLNNPAHLVDSDIVRTFGVKCIVYEEFLESPVPWICYHGHL